MESKVFKNIILYGIGDFIVTGVTAFLLVPLYLKYLSAEDYGIFNILNNNSVILTYIFQFGVISAFSRIYFLRKKENKEKSYINSILFFHLFYSVFLFLALFIFGKYFFYILSPSIVNSQLFLFPIAIAFLSFIPALYYIIARMEHKVFTFVTYQIATVVLLLLFIGVYILFFKLNLNNLIFAYIYTYGIIWAVILLIFIRSISLNVYLKDVTETLKFAFPIFIGYISYFLMSRYSLIILQKYISMKDIGLFSLAQQIAMIPTFLSVAISKAIQPDIFSSNTDEELQVKSKNIDNVYKVFMIWVVGCLIVFIDISAGFFFKNMYRSTIMNVQFLLVINLVYNFSLIENSILLYKMKSRTILFITISGALTNVILSNLLIVHFSINGVLASMLLSYCLTWILECVNSRRFIKYTYDIKKIFLGIIIIIFYIAITQLTSLGNKIILINLYRAISVIILSAILFYSIKRIRTPKTTINQ